MESDRTFHAMTAATALEALGARREGLSAGEAARRREVHGPNRLPETRGRSPVLRFLGHFRNALIYVLIGSAIITAALGHYVDSGVILAVVLANAAIGFLQEGRAEQAMDAIRHMLAPHSSVLRDGRRTTLDAADLVPGDVVLVEAGDRVTADLRLLEARGLKAEEAVLTGESVPVDKGTDPAPADAPLGDRTPMLFSGTLVVALHPDRGRQHPRLWLRRGAHALRRPLHGRCRSLRRGHPRGPARRAHHHPRRGRAGHGAAQCDRPAPSGDRDAGVGLGHLLGQDRDAHAQRDDGGHARRLGRRLFRRGRRLRARGQRPVAGRRRQPARPRHPRGVRPRRRALQRRGAAPGRGRLARRGRPDGGGAQGAGREACGRRDRGLRRRDPHRRDPVRCGASLHGGPASRRRRRGPDLRQGRARGGARDLRRPAQPRGGTRSARGGLLARTGRGTRRRGPAGHRPGEPGGRGRPHGAPAIGPRGAADPDRARGAHRPAAGGGDPRRGGMPRGRHPREDDHGRPWRHGPRHRGAHRAEDHGPGPDRGRHRRDGRRRARGGVRGDRHLRAHPR